MSDEPSITLHSAGLLSKWGFNDGDAPDAWLDWLDERGIPYGNDVWRERWPLVQLVLRYLIPQLDQPVEVYEISTCHNPIRAYSINGVEVDGTEDDSDLTPESVNVPFSAVLALSGLNVVQGEIIEPKIAIEPR